MIEHARLEQDIAQAILSDPSNVPQSEEASIIAELQNVSKRLFTLHKLALPAILYISDVLQTGDRKWSAFLGVLCGDN